MSKLYNMMLEKLVFPLGDLLIGTQVIKQLKIQRSYNNLSSEDLESLQKEKLVKILSHAISTCDAYKEHSIDAQNPFLSLLSFPVINKVNVRDSGDVYLSNKYSKEKLLKYETSGSSGIRTVLYVDKKEQSIFRAILLNWWEWTGYYLGKPMLQTGMSPERGFIKGIKDKLLSTYYLIAFGLTDQTILAQLNELKGKSNLHFGGYASSLYIIAETAKKNNVQMHFDAVISWGDKLFDHYKKSIETAFNTKVYENYACNEGIMIGQKKDLPYFYIYTPGVVLELLDDNNKPVPDGSIGRVVVTKLDGYAMPLIRYDTGDLAVKLPADKYPAKRDFNYPLLERVIGRNTDIIKTSDGINLIVHTFTGIFEFYPQIIQFQIIQNEIDSIIIKYIPSTSFTIDALTQIEMDIRNKTKTSIQIVWQATEEIPPSKSGKPQLVINNLIAGSLTNQT